MKPSKNTNILFYQNLGKLFYAVAAADKIIKEEEINALKEIVKKQWLDIDDFNSDTAYQIEIVFDWLNVEKLTSKKCFDDFIDFKNEHPSVFTKEVIDLIYKTTRAIASSFSGVNKSELIILAKLSIELKKI